MTAADLRAWRKRHDLTQGELAAILGVQLNTVSRWELGQIQPPRYLRLALERLDQTQPG